MSEILSTGFITITDLSDPILSSTEPLSPVEGMLWLDISKTPPVLMVYKDNQWMAVSDTSALPDSVPVGGYFGGDLEINKNEAGSANAGEIQVTTGTFIHPDGSVYTIPSGKAVFTDLETKAGKTRYILFIGSDASRFEFLNASASRHFVDAVYKNREWFYFKNDNIERKFEISDKDCIVAKIEEFAKDDSGNGIKKITKYYEDKDTVFEALTDGGKVQGIYKENGLLFVNAEYIKTGKLSSRNGVSEFNLDNGTFRLGGTGDNDYTLKFDGKNLYFADGAIKWENLDDKSKDNLRNATANIIGGVRAITVSSSNAIQTEPTAYTAKVMLGTQDITSKCTLSWKASGIYTGTSSSSTFTPSKGSYTTNETYIELKAVYNQVELIDRIGIAVSKQGANGANGTNGTNGTNGVSVKSIDVEYAISTSATTAPTSGWQTTAPTWTNGKYIWSRTKTVLSNGNTTYSQPACITGQQGNTGAAGTGISSITEEYYLSTSKTTQTGGSWTTTPPTWSSGKYLWTRNKIVYTNPASTVYTTPVCDSSWEAVNEIEIGGRNLVKNTSTVLELYANGGTNENTGNASYSNFKKDPYLLVKTPLSNLKNWKAGDTITFSYDWVATGSNLSGTFKAGFNASPWEYTTVVTLSSSNTKGRVSYTRMLSENDAVMTSTATAIRFRMDNIPSGTVIKVSNLKLELGNRATDWTPAPEDVDQSIEDIQIGGRNLALKTGTPISLTGFTGASNYCSGAYTVPVNGLELNDRLTISYDFEYTNLTKGSSIGIYLQGWGKASGWSNGVNIQNNFNTGNVTWGSTTTKKIRQVSYMIVNSTTLTDSEFYLRIRTDGITGGSFTIKNFKVEKGNKATDWTPAPEDIDESIENIQIGGRNIIKNSATPTNTDNWVYSPSNIELCDTSTTYAPPWNSKGEKTFSIITTSTSEKYAGTQWYELEPSTEYTFSGWFYVESNVKSLDVYLLCSNTAGGSSNYTYDNILQLVNSYNSVKGKWVRIVKTVKTSSSTKAGYLRIDHNGITDTAVSNGNRLWFSRIKLEKGNKATDWTPAPEDIQGQISNTVSTIDVKYYLSTSKTSLSGGSWTTVAPEWVEGKYMWSKTVTTYASGKVVESAATCIAGATGATGTGITSITEEYYLSTSKTSQSGGSWTTTPPTWSPGKYVWTRSKIVYKNPTSTVYTTPVCDSSWEAVNEIVIGGRNLVINSDVLDNKFSAAGGYAGQRTVVADSDAKCGKHLEFKCTTEGSGPHTPIFPKTANKIGKTYTWSFWAKASVNKTGNVGHECGGIKQISLTTSWQKFTHTWTFTDATYHSFTWYLGWKLNEILYVRDFKIEEGNKATDWTPAPEDTDEAIGNAVKSVETMYYLSTSATSQTGGSWSKTMPAMTSGKFIWVKTVTTLVNGKVTETTPVLYQPDWIQDWSGTKTEIGGTAVLTPKLFAGTKESNGTATGVAIGSNVFGTGANYSGIAGYKQGVKTFHLKTDGSLLIGKDTTGNHFSFDGSNLSIKASSVSIGVNSVATDKSVNDKISGIAIGGENLLRDYRFTGTEHWVSSNPNYASIDAENNCAVLTAATGAVSIHQEIEMDGFKEGDEFAIQYSLKTSGFAAGEGTSSNLLRVQLTGYKDDDTHVSDVCIFGKHESAPPSEWKKYTATGKLTSKIAESTKLRLRLYARNFVGKVMFKDIKLEVGNKVTGLSPSSLDVSDAINKAENLINDNIDNAIIDAEKNIMQNVSENYTNSEEFKKLSDTVSSNFSQTEKDIQMQFTTATDYTKEVDGKLQAFQNTVATNIRFSENGIDLGKTSSPFTATLNNEKLAFKQDNEEVAYISNNKMYITNAEVKEVLRIGESSKGFFSWIQGENGNLTLKWSDK